MSVGVGRLSPEADDRKSRAEPSLPPAPNRASVDAARPGPARHGPPGARHAGDRLVRLHPLLRPLAHARRVHHLRVSRAGEG